MIEAEIAEVAEKILSTDIQTLGPQGFLGAKTRYRKGIAFEKTGIKQCWGQLTRCIDREKEPEADMYGIWGPLGLMQEGDNGQGNLVYIAAAEESVFEGIPEGLLRFTLPRTHYAIASTKLYHEEWEQGVRYIDEFWLPQSEYVRADGFSLEIYPPNHEKGFIGFGVPLKRKH